MVLAVCFSFLLRSKRGETEKSEIRKLLRRWLCVNSRVTHVVQHKAGSLIGKDFAKIVTPVWPVTRCRAGGSPRWLSGRWASSRRPGMQVWLRWRHKWGGDGGLEVIGGGTQYMSFFFFSQWTNCVNLWVLSGNCCGSSKCGLFFVSFLFFLIFF